MKTYLVHAMLLCDHNAVFNDWLVAVLIDIDPELVFSDQTSTNIINRLAVTFFLATAFQIVWRKRQMRKPIVLREIKSFIEAEVAIWKRTKYIKAALLIESALKFIV